MPHLTVLGRHHLSRLVVSSLVTRNTKGFTNMIHGLDSSSRGTDPPHFTIENNVPLVNLTRGESEGRKHRWDMSTSQHTHHTLKFSLTPTQHPHSSIHYFTLIHTAHTHLVAFLDDNRLLLLHLAGKDHHFQKRPPHIGCELAQGLAWGEEGNSRNGNRGSTRTHTHTHTHTHTCTHGVCSVCSTLSHALPFAVHLLAG